MRAPFSSLRSVSHVGTCQVAGYMARVTVRSQTAGFAIWFYRFPLAQATWTRLEFPGEWLATDEPGLVYPAMRWILPLPYTVPSSSAYAVITDVCDAVRGSNAEEHRCESGAVPQLSPGSDLPLPYGQATASRLEGGRER